MAPRKRNLIEDPPSITTTASESSDDEINDYIQLPSSSNKQPVVDDDSSSEEEGSDSSSEELQQSQHAASQNPKPVASAASESDSESEPKPTTPPHTKLASKPVKGQPQAQAQTTPKSGKKRVADDNNGNGNNSKRSKSKEAVSAAAGGSDEEKDDMAEDVRLTGEKSFRKVFSKDDEIVILRGVADFLSKTGNDPMKNISTFHDFVKESLGATVTKEQLKRKIRGLKDKFHSNQIFTKSHDKKAFELFKKIKWGNNGGNVAGEENGKAVKHVGSSSKNVESGVDNNFILNEVCRFGVDMGLSSLNKDAVKQGLEMIDESSRAEMERQWRQLHIAELEVFVKRAQFVTELTSLISD